MTDISNRIPEIRFSEWVPWEQRTGLSCANQPGIYLLLKNSEVPDGSAIIKDKKVIYVGEAGRKLKERWSEFERIAVRGTGNHSGAITYYKKFNGDMENLHVAAMGLDLEEPYAGPIRLFLERKLIMEYVFRYTRLPLCNKK